MLGDVNITGFTLDGSTGAAIGLVNVNATQSFYWANTTSDSITGSYAIGGAAPNINIVFYASKTGYTHTPVTTSAPTNGTWLLNLILFPNYVANNTAIHGLVYTSWNGNPINGATVTISNTSWSATTTSSTTGYYIFDNLAGGEVYNISATATGHSPSAVYSATTVAGGTVQQNIPMTAAYTLTVYARDGVTSNLLVGTTVFIQLSDTQSTSTTNGIATFTVNGGLTTVTGTATGYSPAQTQIALTGDSVATLLMYNTTTSTASHVVYYIPHSVKFTVLTMWAAPVDNVSITARGYETTVGDWDWLKTLLGLPLDEAPIQNSTMGGVTDSTGSINFMMIETVKYNISAYKTGVINKNFTIYPKDDYYVILADQSGQFFSGGCNPAENFNFSVVPMKVATNHYNVTVNITDVMNQIIEGNEFINRTNSTTGQTQIASVAGLVPSNINQTFDVYQTSGINSSVVLTVNFSHTSCGIIRRDFGISFPGEILTPTFIDHDMMFWFAAFCIIFCGCIFGATSAEQGALVVVIVAWIFTGLSYRFYGVPLYYSNALVESGMLLLATFVAVMSNIMTRSKKERYI
jgi:hypothetical protein